jgi:hypothetical protein
MNGVYPNKNCEKLLLVEDGLLCEVEQTDLALFQKSFSQSMNSKSVGRLFLVN